MHEVYSQIREHEATVDRETGKLPEKRPAAKRRWGSVLFGLGVSLLLAGGLALGASRSNSQQRAVTATAGQICDFVPSVRVATVRASPGNIVVTLPATTAAFADANIYARATGYIEKRNVDIGDHVKAGELLRSSLYRNWIIRSRKMRRRLSSSRRRWSKRKPTWIWLRCMGPG